MGDGWWSFSGARLYQSAFDLGWIGRYVGAGDFGFLDVGSYDGGDALRAKLAYPLADVVAVEACPGRFDDVSRVEPYGVKTLRYAVSDADGDAEFMQCRVKEGGREYFGCGSLLPPSDYLAGRFPGFSFSSIRVPSITIETLWRTHGRCGLEVLHMDIEGAELKALRGMGALRPRLVYAEVGNAKMHVGSPSPEEVTGFLSSLGYRQEASDGCNNLYVRQ